MSHASGSSYHLESPRAWWVFPSTKLSIGLLVSVTRVNCSTYSENIINVTIWILQYLCWIVYDTEGVVDSKKSIHLHQQPAALQQGLHATQVVAAPVSPVKFLSVASSPSYGRYLLHRCEFVCSYQLARIQMVLLELFLLLLLLLLR